MDQIQENLRINEIALTIKGREMQVICLTSPFLENIVDSNCFFSGANDPES